MEDVEKWWNSLDSELQRELVEDYYPDKSHLMTVEDMWNGLDDGQKLEIYSENQ